MKKLFLTMVALVVATMSYAQNTLVATLSHGEDISMFYGAYALRDAMNAAVSGDVINLSGGSFQAVDITKAISLRGTGIDDKNPTYIINNFYINIPAEDTNRLSMEGIRCTNTINMSGIFNNPCFYKCQFRYLSAGHGTSIKNITFVNCKITERLDVYGTSTIQGINSYVTNLSTGESTNNNFINSILFFPSSQPYLKSANCCLFVNCIITHSTEARYWDYWSLPSTSQNHHSVIAGPQNLFKDFTGTYSDDQTFELTDEAKAQYLGNDGTEVGIHGGVMPYDSTPSYPQITKMNVANKTTADGKLSVEIEVSAKE